LLAGIRTEDTADEFAFIRFSRSDRGMFDGNGSVVQLQIGFTGGFIRTVTDKTSFGQERLNLPAIGDRFRGIYLVRETLDYEN
jgi:hypothetical protein